jgi:hypothetical protein
LRAQTSDTEAQDFRLRFALGVIDAATDRGPVFFWPRVPVIGIAGQRCDVGDELTASGILYGGGDAHLDAEFVRPVRLAFADALHPRFSLSISSKRTRYVT